MERQMYIDNGYFLRRLEQKLKEAKDKSDELSNKVYDAKIEFRIARYLNNKEELDVLSKECQDLNEEYFKLVDRCTAIEKIIEDIKNKQEV